MPPDEFKGAIGGVSAPQQAKRSAKSQSSASRGKQNVAPRFGYGEVRSMIDDARERTLQEIKIIEGNINARLARFDHLPNKTDFVWGVVGLGALIVAVLALAGERFEGGLGLGTSIGDKFSENAIAVSENSRRDDETRKAVEGIQSTLGDLVSRIDRLIEQSQDNRGPPKVPAAR